MEFRDFLREQYIRQCSGRCNHGGYSRLENEKEKIRKRLIDRYGVNGNKKRVSEQVILLEEIVFSYLNELTEQGFKHYMWITDFHEKELIGRLNTALQST